MRLQLESVFRYDVKFNLPWKRPVGKRDRPLLLRAIEEVKKKHANKEFPPKGQLISNCPFWCLQIDQKTNKIFVGISV